MKNKHIRKKRQQPRPKTKKQQEVAKQSINGTNTIESEMRAMGKHLLELLKDKNAINAMLKEHIEKVEGYFMRYDSFFTAWAYG